MHPLQCPSCSVALTRQEAADGWCETCGKRLPPSRAVAATAPHPRLRAAPTTNLSVLGKWLAWLGLAGLLLCLASCLGLLFVGPLLPGSISKAQRDEATGDIAAGLFWLALTCVLLYVLGKRFRR